MLSRPQRYKEDFLDSKSIDFLCQDIIEIDRLWIKHSNEKFSFRKQKDLWIKIANNANQYDYKSYKKFGNSIGWYLSKDKRWRSWEQLDFHQNSLPGHLPAIGENGIWTSGEEAISLLLRCNL